METNLARMSVSLRLVLLAIGLVVVTAVGGGALLLRFSEVRMREAQLQDLHGQARQRGVMLAHSIDDAYRDAASLARLPQAMASVGTGGGIHAGGQELAAIFGAVMQSHPSYRQICLSAAGAAMRDGFCVGWRDGALAQVTPGESAGSGDACWARDPGTRAVSLYPLPGGRSGSTKQAGSVALCAHADAVSILVDMQTQLHALLQSSRYRVYLGDLSGHLLAGHSGDGIEAALRARFPQLAASLRSSGSGANLSEDAGKLGMIALERVPLDMRIPGDGLVLVLVSPAHQQAEAVASLRRDIAPWILFWIGVAVGLALWLAHALSRPLRQLTRAANSLARGDTSALLPDARAYELAELSKAFARMRRDVTERESELRASEAFSRAIFETAVEGIVTTDERGQILSVNAAALRTFGYERSELVGANVRALMPEPYRGEHDTYMQNYLRTGQARIIGIGREAVGQRKDGSVFPLRLALVDVKQEQGRFFTGFVEDISEAKAREAREQQYLEELKRSNAELEQFAYVASHDLQEPLRMVASFVQLLERRYQGRLDKDADEFIAFAVDGATRMQALIRDLLAYSRVGSRGRPLQPVACESVLAAVLDNLRIAIEDSAAQVRHDPLPVVLGDESQLIQLFQNLIGNAIKFRTEAPPQVDIAASLEGVFWHFRFSDNGIGIDPEYADRIFVIFQRLHPADAYPGTGIGLSVCKKIVERHGGRIWVESSQGHGASFHFTLKAAPHAARGSA